MSADEPPFEAAPQPLVGVEAWLARPWRLAVLVVLATFVLALVTAFSLNDLFAARDRDVPFSRVFALQLSSWAYWALAAGPIVLALRWMRRALRWWVWILLLQIPLSLAATHYALIWNGWLQGRFFDMPVPTRGLFDHFGAGDPVEGRAGGPLPGERPPRGRFGAPGDNPRGSGANPGGPGELDPEGRPRGPLGPRGGPRGMAVALRTFRLWREFSIYWAILGIALGVGAFLETRSQERRATGAELRAARLRAELERAKVGSLEAQLQPHFVFNALHAVGGLIREREDKKALKTLSALGELLRRTLAGGDRETVRLADELDVTERYLDIERIRLGDRLHFERDVPVELYDARVPAFCLLPMVENAVKHAVSPRAAGGRIVLRAAREGEVLQLEVSDDGPGFPPEVVADPSAFRNGEDRPHIGLANARERLQLLYGAEGSLRVENPPTGGGCVRIRLPYTSSEGDVRSR